MGRRGRPPYPDILTPREWEVLALLREGLTNEGIAARLGVTHAAAKYHVSEILSKLGVATREEAAAWSREPAEAGQTACPGEPRLRRWGLAVVGWLRPVTVGKAALITAAVAALAGLGVLAVGSIRTSDEPQAFDLPDSYEQMLEDGQVFYLAPADRSLWIADDDLVKVARIRVVDSVPALEDAAAGPTSAVIIDRELAGDVSPEWALDQLDHGTVIVGAG